MNKIKRVSLFFKLFFMFVFVFLPVVYVVGWMNAPDQLHWFNHVILFDPIPNTYSNLVHGQGLAIMHTLSATEKLYGFLLSTIPLAIELSVLYFLIKLFSLYEQGEIFSMQNVRYLRNIGFALLIGQLVNPFYEGIMGVVLTWHNPPGHRFAAVSLDQTNIGILLTALLVILISWIMAEGCKLREEQQLTI